MNEKIILDVCCYIFYRKMQHKPIRQQNWIDYYYDAYRDKILTHGLSTLSLRGLIRNSILEKIQTNEL